MTVQLQRGVEPAVRRRGPDPVAVSPRRGTVGGGADLGAAVAELDSAACGRGRRGKRDMTPSSV